MLRKFVIAAGTLAALTAPALSAQSWYVIRSLSDNACYAVQRTSSPGEQLVGGPFASQAGARHALDGYAACIPPTHSNN